MQVNYPDERFFSATALITLLDLIWFSTASNFIYPPFEDVCIMHALLAWTCIGVGIACGRPETIEEAAAYGAALGFVTYGVFNGTESAIRKDWRKPHVIVADVCWGTSACTAVSCTCYALLHIGYFVALVSGVVALTFMNVIVLFISLYSRSPQPF
jgi:uncharacterized membrane protein